MAAVTKFLSIGILMTLLVSTPGLGLVDTVLDKFECKPEIMGTQSSYYCDSHGNIICNEGWSDPDNMCRTAVCEQNCENGQCVSPNRCFCEIGWTGHDCGTCVKRPGCVNGYCSSALECHCFDGFTGDNCDIPICSDGCLHGTCVGVDECRCFPGWTGPFCDECHKLPGCKYGECHVGNDCVCQHGYEGAMCDIPICVNCSANGECVAPSCCRCFPGWTNNECTQCVKPGNCPNGYGCLSKPYECVNLSNHTSASTTARTEATETYPPPPTESGYSEEELEKLAAAEAQLLDLETVSPVTEQPVESPAEIPK